MAAQDVVTSTDRFEVKVTADTHFGWLRTRLSVERTMMSWIRTAVSLIGFGFAIVQFFERLRQMTSSSDTYFPQAPKYLGLSLIACGIMALLISIWQYRWTVNYLRSGSFEPIAGLREGMQSPVIAVAVLLVGIGLFAFGAVLLHLV